VRDQFQVHLGPHGCLAEDGANIEHAKTPDLQEILEQRRAAAFEGGRRDS